MNPKKYLSLLVVMVNIALTGISYAVVIELPDYQVTSVSPDRLTQVEGGTIVFTAVIKNKGGSTLRSSTVAWRVCTEICAKDENWTVNETDTIAGLKENEEKIVTYIHEVALGVTELSVKCDYLDGNNFGVIVEKYETDTDPRYPKNDPYDSDKDNNILLANPIITPYPDLTIATETDDENDTNPSIWWTPQFPLDGEEVTFYAGISNQGAGGSINDFEVEFIILLKGNALNTVSLGSEKYKDGIPLGPMPKNYTFCNIASKDTWPAIPGSHIVEVRVNEDKSINEGTNRYDNNNAQKTIGSQYIRFPDLVVRHAWWVPQTPKDGEEVTFYASIENIGTGGSIQEFDIEFLLTEQDYTGYPMKDISLGSATVKDQILPAQKKPIHEDESGNFEYEYISDMDWNIISGTISIESHCLESDSMCKEQLKNSNLKYLRLSGANSVIRSKNSFQIDSDTLVFRAQASGSGKRYFSLCKPGTNCQGTNQLMTQEIATSKSTWQAYVLDVRDINEPVTCEIRTGTSSNAILKIDDIRMTPSASNDSPVLVAIPFSDSWEAFPFSDIISQTPGSFTVTARLPVDDAMPIKEDPMQNKQWQEHTVPLQQNPPDPWIEPANYEFIDINRSPPTQFIGKNFVYEVELQNLGGPTLIDSNLNWYLSTPDAGYGKSLETDEISGLMKNGKSTQTFEIPVVSGNMNIHAFLNDDALLKESNPWSENDLRYNRISSMTPVDDVDLAVKKIWWRVEDPLPGQNVSEPYEGQLVRFYARIDNIGSGGAITDFDVQFIVDASLFEAVDLKTTTVKDDILFGRRGWTSSAMANGGFEGNCSGSKDKLCDWTIVSGSVSAESYCGIDDTHCICSRSDDSDINVNPACNPSALNGNLHYARLSGAGTQFKSGSFYVTGDIIEFKAQVVGSGDKKIRVCKVNNPDTCVSETYTGKSYWNAYVIDVSSFIGQEAFLELSTEGSGNMEFWVDDFRMDVASHDPVFVTTVASKDTWPASTGSHEITVIADVKNVLPEPDDYDPANPTTTNNVKSTIITEVGQTDYQIIKSPTFPELQRQIQERNIHVMAEITNIGSSTALETDLYWYACLDAENPSCAEFDLDNDNWKSVFGNPATKEKVPALANGEVYTSVFTYTADYGKTYVIAEVNPELNVSEEVLHNNRFNLSANTEVYKPALFVKSIWWIPEKPKDGEEVTFYAAIENELGHDTGGTLDDFDVNFTIIDNNNKDQTEDLGTTKIKDDIQMADRRIIDEFQSSVFDTQINTESNTLAPWKKISGSVSIVDRCFQHYTKCEETISNRYYARLYGANTLLRSNEFTLENNMIIFSGYTNGSGSKIVRVKHKLNSVPNPMADTILREIEYTEKQTWRSNVIELPSGYTGEKVYIELLTQDGANAEFVVDDFRMTLPSTDDIFVTIAQSNKVWTAQPGSFDISVAVSLDKTSSKGKQIELLNDPSDTELIKNADYTVSEPQFNLEKQIQGKDVVFTATVTNIGASTLVESEIHWIVNNDSTKNKITKEKIEGLAAGQVYTSTFTLTPDYLDNTVEFKCNATGTINESDVDNNSKVKIITIDKPKLTIGPIWWSPTDPKDGEEVTFYARIDNEGSGGSSEDIEVRFLVSQGINGKQTEISKEKVSADIPFALGTAAFNNSDFSGGTFTCTGLPTTCSGSDTLNDWFILGEVFAESRCTLDDKQCPEKIIALPDTPNLNQCGYESYARLYGNTILRSNATFEKKAVKYILFKAYTSGSGNKKVQILDEYYEPVLNYPITSKSWAAHIIDVAPYSLDFANKDYYFQAQTEGAANASLMIDDIRIVSTTLENCAVMVDKVTSSKTWVAQPKLSETASDFFIHIEATDSTGAKTIRSEMINPVSQSDYDIKVITHSPQEQIKGKTVKFTAVVVNNGADTNVVSELSWFTCNESEGDCSIDNNWQKKYKEAQTDTVSPLDFEMQYTSTFLLTTAFGNNRVIAYCDSGEVIVEPDDNSNPTDLNNNLKDDSIEIKKPDLRISKIGYSPADPVDGENVIFYAQIENVYKGGTIDEVETQFKVTDENGVETTIDAEKTGNEVMFARRRPVFDNSDFEQKSLNNWISQGTVFLEKEPLSDSYKVIESLYDAKDDQYYAKVYGDGSRLLSQEFRIVGSESSSIIFKGQSTGSGTKQIFVRQYPTYGNPTSSDPILTSLTFSEKSPWKVGIIDVSAHHNKNVYLEVLTSGADNSEFWVDDFRMADGSDPVFVSIVQAKNPWIAVPGNHTLLAQVDSNNNIPENDESNPNGEANNTLEKTFNPTNSVDYSITTMTYTPEEQVQGKDIVFTAVIKNDTPNTTLIESELEWFVCQGDIKYCDYQEKWESKAKEKVAGLTAYGEYTSTFNMEVTYSSKEPTSDQSYLLQVKVICDTGNVITEDAKPDSELNNEAVSTIQIYHPDLEIGDIWWLPENPVYGESVKFFARIDNFGKGGTVQDFEVSFIVDYEDTDNSVDLGTTKMTTEVPFGMREPLPVNPSFENGLKGWTVLSGNVNWESICPENDTHCPGENAKNRYGDLYYASVYGDNSIFRTTNAFQKKGNSLLFRGYTSGSGTKKLVIYDTNNTNLLERTYTDKSPWRAYVINIQEIEDNTDIYIEIQTNGASNATFMVDDFRMGENNSERSIVGYVESKSAWTAQPDFPAKVHSISAIVDSKAVVKEVKDDLVKDNKSDEDIPSIGRPDYQVAITDYSPQKQIQGRNMQFTAVIDNPYSTTLVDSELQWSICQDSLITCKDGDEYKKYWEIKQTDKMIGGIAEGQQYTVFFNLTVPSYVGTEPEENPDGYTIYVRAKADVNSAILEKDDADANFFIQQVEIDHPDLIVKEIWWIPESPIDGQEVTFYAQIANQGNGGTLEDYEVNFVVDKGNELTEEDLGTAKIQDDIPLGNRLPLLSNANAIGITKNIGDFEGEPILAKSDAWPITNWMRYSGDIYIANHFQDSQLPNSENKKPDNLKYLYISGTGARVKSPPFQLWGDALMFRGQANGSGNKTVRIWLYDPNNPDNENQTPLHEELYNDKSPWRAYLIDIEKWHKFMVYLEIETSNGSFFVDDFRMIQAPQYTQGAIIVATAANPKTWLARNGAKITAEVDPKQDIYEDPRIINLNKRMASDRYTRPFSWHGENNNILTRTIILKNSNSLGDIDANGEKNLKDLILAAKIAASFDFPFNDGFILDNVDVDGDNDIGLAEMIYLMVYIAEKQDSH